MGLWLSFLGYPLQVHIEGAYCYMALHLIAKWATITLLIFTNPSI